MAQPKVHITDPTYDYTDLLNILDHPDQRIYTIPPKTSVQFPMNWNEAARYVVAKRLFDSLPDHMGNRRNWDTILELVNEGPNPRAGVVCIRSDNSVYYLSTGLTSNHEGLSAKWDGMLKG